MRDIYLARSLRGQNPFPDAPNLYPLTMEVRFERIAKLKPLGKGEPDLLLPTIQVDAMEVIVSRNNRRLIAGALWRYPYWPDGELTPLFLVEHSDANGWQLYAGPELLCEHDILTLVGTFDVLTAAYVGER